MCFSRSPRLWRWLKSPLLRLLVDEACGLGATCAASGRIRFSAAVGSCASAVSSGSDDAERHLPGDLVWAMPGGATLTCLAALTAAAWRTALALSERGGGAPAADDEVAAPGGSSGCVSVLAERAARGGEGAEKTARTPASRLTPDDSSMSCAAHCDPLPPRRRPLTARFRTLR